MPTSNHRSTNVPHNPTPRHTPLNAISPRPADPEQAERRARHLAVCQELIELGLKLTRAAAAQALEAIQNPQPTPTDPHQAKTPDPNLAFTRLSGSVRQSVELEEKIANNAFARRTPPAQATWPAPDPESDLDGEDEDPDAEDTRPEYSLMDRGNLIEAASRLTATHPDQAELHQIIPEIVEEILTRYPNCHASENFHRVCVALDIPADRTSLPNYLESQLRPLLE